MGKKVGTRKRGMLKTQERIGKDVKKTPLKEESKKIIQGTKQATFKVKKND